MKQLKIGIFGTGRGCDIAENFRLLGCEITALCDFNPDRLAAAAQRLGGDIAQYQDFDSFIEHDMDAVVLANYFHEHAPYAIRCFERGIHGAVALVVKALLKLGFRNCAHGAVGDTDR